MGEKECDHGDSCRGKAGGCPRNHPRAKVCRYEKGPTHRCGRHSCGYNHYLGREAFVVEQRIAYQEKKLTEEVAKAGEIKKDSGDSLKCSANTFDELVDSDDEEVSSLESTKSTATSVVSESGDDQSAGSGEGFQEV